MVTYISAYKFSEETTYITLNTAVWRSFILFFLPIVHNYKNREWNVHISRSMAQF